MHTTTFEEHGVDLIQEESESHVKEFKKILNIDGITVRIDSLMISSSCRKLSRLEIMYSCVHRLINKIQELNLDIFDDGLKVYLEKGHRNDTIYRFKYKDIDSKMKTLIIDAVKLFDICYGQLIEETDEFKTFSRIIVEQTQNTYSDQKFSKDTIDKLGKQEQEIDVLVYGAYYSGKLANEAKKILF